MFKWFTRPGMTMTVVNDLLHGGYTVRNWRFVTKNDDGTYVYAINVSKSGNQNTVLVTFCNSRVVRTVWS